MERGSPAPASHWCVWVAFIKGISCPSAAAAAALWDSFAIWDTFASTPCRSACAQRTSQRCWSPSRQCRPSTSDTTKFSFWGAPCCRCSRLAPPHSPNDHRRGRETKTAVQHHIRRHHRRQRQRHYLRPRVHHRRNQAVDAAARQLPRVQETVQNQRRSCPPSAATAAHAACVQLWSPASARTSVLLCRPQHPGDLWSPPPIWKPLPLWKRVCCFKQPPSVAAWIFLTSGHAGQDHRNGQHKQSKQTASHNQRFNITNLLSFNCSTAYETKSVKLPIKRLVSHSTPAP